MKKVLAFAIAILCAATFVQAQEGESTNQKKQATELAMFGIGARLAVGYGMIWGLEDDWSGGENDENPGGIDLEGGAMGRIVLTPVLQFTPELLFRYANYSQDDDLGERKFKQMNVEIPLLVRAVATPEFYAYIGPQLGLNLSHDVSLKAKVSNKAGTGTINHSIPEKVEQASFGFSVAVGAGYFVIDKLALDFRVGFGLSELYPDSKGGFIDLSGAKDLSFKFGLNYWVF